MAEEHGYGNRENCTKGLQNNEKENIKNITVDNKDGKEEEFCLGNGEY